MNVIDAEPQPDQSAYSNRIGDVLQASGTIAGVVIALVIFWPSSIQFLILEVIPSWRLPLVPLLFLLSGFLALATALRCVDAIRREAGIPFESLILVRHTLGYLFCSLLLVTVLYIVVMLGLVYPVQASGK